LKKTVKKLIYLVLILSCFSSYGIAKERWILDKKISEITFEVPVLFAKNVMGKFNTFDGFVEIDTLDQKNNKAILSVNINSLEMNYKKYKNLILSDIFFNSDKYPIGVIDTKKFAYNNEEKLNLDIELTIKGITRLVNTELLVIRLTNDLVQIKSELKFSRNDFNIGTGNWKNTTILKDKIKINSNIFLFKE
tara:strand:+ start:223 stop:798 length:576 start_codon:yes stop_codon:yes gene_type:complete